MKNVNRRPIGAKLPKKLCLSRNTVRALTARDLMAVDGAMPTLSNYGCFPKSNAWPDGCP